MPKKKNKKLDVVSFDEVIPDLVHLDTNNVPQHTDPPKPEPKAVKITIEYDDGSKKEATGADAASIMQHWDGLESFWWVHGGRYTGPCLKPVVEEKE